ncbi:IS66 family transposase zinc-finger binding domain-containing protein [Thermoactinomyces mirandus]|uniref:IS66 family transposase zinc-finger binding domain-containing protein n=1 Tax=Thermoactinomyces mirandus TaxID=2756294 RepID=A0A7W1XRI5_9BACL|nr:IS66 family transposase zinc-finger binding domain-containing protein [Thermoactinomyces mirandus]
MILAKVKVIRYVRHVYACRHCKRQQPTCCQATPSTIFNA